MSAPRSSSAPRLSLVVATYNRPQGLERLLEGLARQALDRGRFEVLVVDDGSQPPAAAVVEARTWPFACRLQRQDNAGPAAARHRGIASARGEIVIVVDDDMELPAGFLDAHDRAHAAGTRRVVLGHIRPAPELERLPLFERFHAAMLERFVAGVRAGVLRVRGTHVCTGNVSFPRVEYLAVGGFDRTLDRSEDAELGIRFEKAGLELVFDEGAYSVHRSDHVRLDVWLRRAYRYGLNDLAIGRKHADAPWASPWRLFGEMSPLARPLLALSLGLPGLAGRLARAGMAMAGAADRLGWERLALAGTTVVYGMQYFRGLRAGCGSARAAWGELRTLRWATRPPRRHRLAG